MMAMTCAEHMDAAATFLAQFEAVTKVRPPTAKEKSAAARARKVIQDYGLTIPASLAD